MKQGKNQKQVRRILFAQLVLIATAAVLCCFMAVLIQGEKIPELWGGTISEVLLEIIVFLVCFITVRPLPQNRLPLSAATAGIFLLIRVLVKSIAFPQTQWTMIWGMILSGAAALLAGVSASTKKQRRR